MERTYTTNLSLAKFQSGDKNWGTAMNLNFDTLAAAIFVIPSQTGKDGQVLSTDGTILCWTPIDGGTF